MLKKSLKLRSITNNVNFEEMCFVKKYVTLKRTRGSPTANCQKKAA